MSHTAIPSRHSRAIDMVMLALLICIGAAMVVVMSTRPADPGVWEDDAVYLATSKALADGAGYRHIELPGEPWQTKYPPAYPALVAIFWKAGVDLLESPLPLGIANTLMVALGHWLTFRMLTRSLKITPMIAGAGVLLSMSNFMWFELCTSSMSESLYLLAASGAMAAGAAIVTPSTAISRVRWKLAIVAGLLAALAILTRSIGITLVGGIAFGLLVSKRWREAIPAVAIPLAAYAGWAIWRAGATKLNAAIPQASALRYELDYSSWLALDPSRIARIAWLNLGEGTFNLFYLLRNVPSVWVFHLMRGDFLASNRPIPGGPLTGSLIVLGALGLMLWLIIAGFWQSRRGSGGIIQWCVAFYIALVLIWPFSPIRFLAVLLPILIPMALQGAADLVPARRDQHGRLIAPGKLGLTPRQWIGFAVAVAIMSIPAAPQSLGTFLDPPLPGHKMAIDGARKIITANTTETDTVACISGGVMHLYTGRKFILTLPGLDPYNLAYPADRSFGGFNIQDTPLHQREMERWISLTPEYYRAAGAGYVFAPHDQSPTGQAWSQFCIQRTDVFRAVAHDEIGTLRRVLPKP